MECMNDVSVEDLKDMNTVLFLTSTAGQGEFPSNAKDFYTSLSAINESDYLKGLNVGVFGLGDHGYVHFNKAAKDLASKLTALGASSLTPAMYGDDRDEEKFETKFYEWLPSLYGALHCEKVLHEEPPTPHYTVSLPNTPHGKAKPFKPLRSHLLPLKETRRLTPADYDRDIRHFAFDLTGTKVKYNVGDTLGVYAQNDPQRVSELLTKLGLTGNEFVSVKKSEEIRRSLIPSQTDVRTLFTEVLDVFGRPTRRFYNLLSRLATDPKERQVLESVMTNEGAALLKEFSSESLTYADILSKFPSAKPSLAMLLELVPTMKPRFYSIASSPLLSPDAIQLCVVGVDWKTPSGAQRHGQCTSYLRRLQADGKTQVRAVVSPGTMQLPEKAETPVIMAGLGTGIAPFKAITEHRVGQARAGEKVGNTILFYGCRYRKEFVYGDLWEQYEKEGVLSHVIPAFSREQSYKIYVQDRIRENAKLVADSLVKEGGYFYYCGLAGRAPAQIRQGLIDALKKAEGMSEDKADAYLTQMEKDGRYNLECWCLVC